MERISIRYVEAPKRKDQRELIRWFCMAFGLESSTDKGIGIEEELLRELAEATYSDKGLSSSKIKLREGVARSTVIYHLNRLMEAGLVTRRGRRYYLRSADMYRSIEEIEYDLTREMKRMLDFAKEFDRVMLAKHSKEQRVLGVSNER
jgi:DNA-binding transcriptional ArsR family regulator